MDFLPYIHVLSIAFLMGLAAAAPIGPVNMMAIRRGVVGGWRHTLACGIGSVFADLVLFSLALLGGRYLLPRLLNPKLQIVLVAIGVVVLFPVGAYFLALAVKNPRRAYNSARHRWSGGSIPERLALEAAKAAALTIFNLCLAKIPSACVFIAFQLARVGRSRRLLTVKISRRLFNFSAGWSFGEAQLFYPPRAPRASMSRRSLPTRRSVSGPQNYVSQSTKILSV